MIFITALWHAMPFGGWGWGGLGLVAVGMIAAALLGFWPVVRGFIEMVVGLIPWNRWETYALIGAAVGIFGFRVWLDMHDAERDKAAAAHEATAVTAKGAERDRYWQGREDASNEAHAAVVRQMQSDLDATRAQLEAANKKSLAADAAAQKANQDVFDQLLKERSAYVTSKAVAGCTLSRGVVLRFNTGSAAANTDEGGADTDSGPSAADAAAIDEPSGVALDIYSDGVTETQRAAGLLRKQVKSLQARERDIVVPLVATLREKLAACINPPTPKGNP